MSTSTTAYQDNIMDALPKNFTEHKTSCAQQGIIWPKACMFTANANQ